LNMSRILRKLLIFLLASPQPFVGGALLAFHLNIMRLSNLQQIITFADCNLVLVTFLINESNIEPAQKLVSCLH